jgi:hypothetical protein
MVQERASVFMGVLFASASRILGNATKKGPARRLVAVNYILSFRGQPFHADRPERKMAEGYI